MNGQNKIQIIDQLKELVFKATKNIAPNVKIDEIILEHPGVEDYGDYSTNVALRISKELNLPPRKIAEELAESLRNQSKSKIWEKVEVAGPGFINFFLTQEILITEVEKIHSEIERYGRSNILTGQKIMVEFAHPNTHKQFHIGHLRNIILGESLVRLLEGNGANAIRANYQGDVGMHVAKALWGIRALKKQFDTAKSESIDQKIKFLADAYVLGNKNFEEDESAKKEIVKINKQVYEKNPEIMPLWQETRQWSLDYFEGIYKRLSSHFDRYFFESEVAELGKKLVMTNLGKVFQESEGAIIFPGDKFSLHNRVFINSEGNPTYEAKDLGLAKLQFSEYNPDLILHNVATEQIAYFQVIFEAIAQVFPDSRGKEKHLAYGWVKLKQGKMSSRSGNVVLGEWLLDEIKKKLREKYPEKVSDLEAVAVGAAKYSILKVGSSQEIAFDIDESISLDGDSGPYIQYTYARASSVLRKAGEISNFKFSISKMEPEEESLIRYLYRFPEIVQIAARNYSPNLICTFLFELAKRYNNLYNNVPILGPVLRSSPTAPGLNNVQILNAQDEQLISQRVLLTEATSIILKNGLNLLGISSLEKM